LESNALTSYNEMNPPAAKTVTTAFRQND